MLDTSIRKQTQITVIKHEPSYKQLEVKTNRTSFLCGNCNGLHNTEFRTTNSNVNERLTTSWSRKINNHENNTKMLNFRMHVIWCGFFGYSCLYPFVLKSHEKCTNFQGIYIKSKSVHIQQYYISSREPSEPTCITI